VARISVREIYGTHWYCTRCRTRMVGSTLLLRGKSIERIYGYDRWVLERAGENETVEFADLSCACRAGSRYLQAEPIKPRT